MGVVKVCEVCGRVSGPQTMTRFAGRICDSCKRKALQNPVAEKEVFGETIRECSLIEHDEVKQ